MNKKIVYRNVLIVLIALVPALMCWLYINSCATNVLFMDDWEMATFYAKTNANHLTFADLFALHNEHRLFFPRLVYWGIASVTHFNTTAHMLASVFLLTGVALIIARYTDKRKEIDNKKKYFAIIILPWLIFSLTQYENLLWGFAIQNMLVLLFTVASFYYLSRILYENQSTHRSLHLTIALISALIASFSSIQGLIVWITGSVLMLLVWRKKSFKTPAFLIWNVAAVATWIAYFHNYVKPEHHPSLAYLFEHPGAFLHYFFSITGNAISGTLKAGVTVAGVVLVVFLLIACVKIWRSKQVQQFIFPLALALNSLFILGSIAVGRAGFGAEQALASRYTTFSVSLVVAVALLWMELKDKAKKKTVIKNMTSLLAVILIISMPLTLAEGFQNGKKIKTDRDYGAYVLETITMQPNQFIQRLYPWPDSVRTRAAYLQQQHLSVFYHPQYAVPELLHNDSLAIANDEVLQFAQNTLQFAPDFMVVLRPVVHPKYKSDVTALYADVDGQVFPLYYKPAFNNRPPNPASIYDVSAISNRVLQKGVHAIKFKALRRNNAGYYLINPDWAFEIK
jgi:hypothetical protein